MSGAVTMTRKYSLLILAVLVIGVLACSKRESAARSAARSGEPSAGTSAETAGKPQAIPEVGAQMPPYKGEWLDGKEFELASEKGNVILVNIWATWCPPCRAETPLLQKMYDKQASRGFKVIGVSVDDSGVEGVRKFVADNKMTYPVAIDAEGRLMNMFQTTIIPMSIVIDRKGKIVWKGFGAIDPADTTLTSAIEAALVAK